ncbi:PAS domain-containing protein [Methylobacterium fujisawaense]|uniref:PAS domain-containing protein n=1 Tax=Methylobacterium fujisawaense TaxID=107400 RepID=UPI0015FD88EB
MFGVRRAHSTDFAAFEALLYSNNRLARADTIARVRCSSGIYGVDYRIVHPGGQIRRLRSRRRVQVDEEGQPVRHRGVVFDIDAYKRAEEEQKTVEAQVRTREARLYAIPDAMTEGMIVIDERGIIPSFNPAAEGIFGYRSAEIVGRKISLVLPEPDRDRSFAACRHGDGARRSVARGRGDEARGLRLQRETVRRESPYTTFARHPGTRMRDRDGVEHAASAHPPDRRKRATRSGPPGRLGHQPESVACSTSARPPSKLTGRTSSLKRRRPTDRSWCVGGC